jgi:hypothetical protein
MRDLCEGCDKEDDWKGEDATPEDSLLIAVL